MIRLLRKLRRDRDGGTAIEYGLIAGLVSIVMISTIQLLGGKLVGVFTTISSTLGLP